jgi:diaminohydroxyphosphoribosylaminopyrimidine deaminase/5-amino-6-(5-phosphoribosylamino)uracil reductase
MISRNSFTNSGHQNPQQRMTDAADARHMRHALTLARRGLGQVWPNPAVGCVLVRDGHVIGRGWTQPGGRPHAEAMALQGVDAREATAYVTLEPCSHHGKTPPCADALIAAGVSRVVVPLVDPDPRVAGQGLDRLRAAGLTVDLAPAFVSAAEDINAGFLLHRRIGRPLVTLKLATSLDGRIATARGESRWITGPAARRTVHMMRATHDAVMIGAGTARADDPMLDIRDLGLAHRAPVRIIADGSLSLPLTGRLAQSAEKNPLWLMHRAQADPLRQDAWKEAGATLHSVQETAEGRLDPLNLLQTAANAGITRVFCEGGGQLAASLLSAGLVDRLVVMQAGLGLGAQGLAAIADLDIPALADAPRFTLDHVTQLGGDTLSQWRPVQP